MRTLWLDPDLQPTQWTYWFMMQIAMVLGFATTFGKTIKSSTDDADVHR